MYLIYFLLFDRFLCTLFGAFGRGGRGDLRCEPGRGLTGCAGKYALEGPGSRRRCGCACTDCARGGGNCSQSTCGAAVASRGPRQRKGAGAADGWGSCSPTLAAARRANLSRWEFVLSLVPKCEGPGAPSICESIAVGVRAFPGPQKRGITTPRTKTSPRGPRTRGTQHLGENGQKRRRAEARLPVGEISLNLKFGRACDRGVSGLRRGRPRVAWRPMP